MTTPIAGPTGRQQSKTAQPTGARTLGEMVLAREHNGGAALRYKADGLWHEMLYKELVRTARGIAKGLIALGVERGDRVSILSDTRPEWTLADAGSFCAGTVVAPIYQSNSPEECEYVLAHSEARAVFCEDAAQAAKVAQVRAGCPALEHVVVLTGRAPGAMTLDELIDRGSHLSDEVVRERVAAVAPGDLATLIYTSGTTGPPKACMLTHGNIRAATATFEDRLGLLRSGAPIEFFLFLPLAHALTRVAELFTLDTGGTLIYWQRDPAKLLDDLREAAPTYFPSVPRVWEKIHTAATAGIADQPRLKRAVFGWSVATGRRARELERRGERPGRLLAARRRVADHLVLSKVRDLFGGRIVLAVSAAAPIADEVLLFFDSCGIAVLEGWGMTETCAAGTINIPEELKFGSVGRPLPAVRMRVAEDGELLAQGPNIFTGYYKDDEATAATLVDGWLATGDLGRIDADGFVHITGRKKELIITSSGKNISPANIENALKQSRWISEAVVYGDKHPYLVAVVTLDGEEAPALARRLGVDPDPVAMAAEPRVHAAIAEVVDRTNQRFARIEQVKRFHILGRELTQEAGELTPTLKVKRAVLYRKFADVFEGLYQD
jgi:long-chain acyl-CoA synthetase